MSLSTRRQKIEQMLLEEPHDTFLRYSLAMEMAKEHAIEEALELLNELCTQSPPYVPAYFRSAQLLVDEDRIEEARSFLRDGIDAARVQGDQHAAAEMSELLADLGTGSNR
jgi:GAF domain-containing protein